MSDKMFENNQVVIVGEIVSDFQFSHEVSIQNICVLYIIMTPVITLATGNDKRHRQ